MLLLAALLAFATPVPPATHIANGERALAALEYETAAYELMLAATDPAATDTQKLQANLLAGEAHRILGRDTEARLNFRYVLLRAPQTRLPDDKPPKVRLFFESVRQEMEAEQSVRAPPPVDPPTTPAPSVADARQSGGGLAFAGIATIAAGVVVAAGGAAGTVFAETNLADPARAYDERRGLVDIGLASLAGVGAGVVIAAVGGVLLVAGSAP